MAKRAQSKGYDLTAFAYNVFGEWTCDPDLMDIFIGLKEEMTEIAFDYSNPIGDDLARAAGIIDDIHLLRPVD